MADIKKYTKKDGSAAYMFNAYLGTDPITGKKKRTTRRGFKTSKEANLALSRLLVETDDYGLRNNEKVTFKEVYEEWFRLHSQEIKPSTVYVLEKKFVRWIMPAFGNLRIKDISTGYCQKVINQWAQELKSFNDYKIQANQVFKFAFKMDIIKVNPMDRVMVPKKKNDLAYAEEKKAKDQEAGKAPMIDFYSKDQLKGFLGLLDKDSMQYAMFRLLAFTGARKGEILALHWSDIDFKTNSLHLKKTLTHIDGKKVIMPSKTKTSSRIISIDDTTAQIMKHWRALQIQLYMKLSIPFQNDTKQPVFTSYIHQDNRFQYCRPAYPNDQLERIYSANSTFPRITVHGFRHTHASLLFESGATIKDVQTRLGHSDIQTTMNIYTHVTNEAKEKTAEKFQKYMNF